MTSFVDLTLPLDADTERFLAWAARAGDRSALHLLVEAGQPWVRMHAARLGHRGEQHDEAVAAGLEGLLRAVERFDPSRGARLATFAWSWIARAMQPPPRLEHFRVPLEVPRGNDAILDSLPVPQAEVLRLRFGFGDGEAETLSRHEVAVRLGLSPWQVRDREAKAIAVLRGVLGRVSNRAP